MSNRSADSAASQPGTGTSERRKNAGQRLQFEALIAMADTQGGAGFEAESVDVSSGGMRLRTAYVPPVGEKLVCRFDNAGQEVSVTGEVLWRNEQPRGGEFGIRFLDLDKETAEMLRSMCAVDKAGPEAGAASTNTKNSPSMRGTRVRLHIEGLGSPMKARVREADSGEMLVGSNLEFLKVGRTLDLEDVDHGTRREAFIDHVKVDIDGATHIPQLVVSLRYADGEKAAKTSAAPGKSAQAVQEKAAPKAVAPSPKAASKSIPDNSASILQSQGGSADDAHKSEIHVSNEARDGHDGVDTGDESDVDFGDEERTGKLTAFGRKASQGAKAVAGTVGPKLLAASAKTKNAVAGLFGSLAKKRSEKAESEQQGAAPRRTTAPPPTGALRSEGKRLVRDEQGSEEAEESQPPRMNRKAAIFGSALGLLAVLAIFGVTRFMAAKAPASDPNAASAETQANAALTATQGAAPMLPPGAMPSGVLTVEVPLFGATPLSTTEPVPPPPDPSALAALPPGAAGLAPNPGANNAAADLPEPSLSDQAGDDEDGEGSSGSSEPGQKQWGQGKVKNPIVLRLKMDGPVEQVNGAAGAMGFTISLPGRRSLSTSSELARKDKRIASLQVVNTAQGAEITLQFKDGVPAYMARAKGNKLEIALGSAGKKKVASKEGADNKKKQADKKKSSKGSKKDASKKKNKKPAH